MTQQNISFSDTVTPSDELVITYYGPPGVPSFSHSIFIGNVEDIKEKFTFNFSNITFYNLSSAYSLQYRVYFDKQKVIRRFLADILSNQIATPIILVHH